MPLVLAVSWCTHFSTLRGCSSTPGVYLGLGLGLGLVLWFGLVEVAHLVFVWVHGLEGAHLVFIWVRA